MDLHALSPIAPRHDLVLGILAIAVACLVANVLVVPRVRATDPRAGARLLAATCLGCVAAATSLALTPGHFYAVVLAGIVLFAGVGLAVASRALGWPQALLRVGAGTAGMLLALALACFAAFLPR